VGKKLRDLSTEIKVKRKPREIPANDCRRFIAKKCASIERERERESELIRGNYRFQLTHREHFSVSERHNCANLSFPIKKDASRHPVCIDSHVMRSAAKNNSPLLLLLLLLPVSHRGILILLTLSRHF
jgi:hypothetical protein